MMNRQRSDIYLLAEEFGVSLRTLRFYEQRGLLKPDREKNNHRVYTPTDRVRLNLIVMGKRLGFSLAEISQMIEARDDGSAIDTALALNPETVARRINELLKRRDEVDLAIAQLREALARVPDDGMPRPAASG